MAYVPDEAVDRITELSRGASLLYYFLCRCRNHRTFKCNPSVQTSMEAIGVNRGSIFALRKELIEKKWAKFNGDQAILLVGFSSPKNQTPETDNDRVADFQSAISDSSPHAGRMPEISGGVSLKNQTDYQEPSPIIQIDIGENNPLKSSLVANDSKGQTASLKNQTGYQTDGPIIQTSDTENNELKAEELGLSLKNQTIPLFDPVSLKNQTDSLKNQTLQSEKSDLHIRKNQQKNQQREPKEIMSSKLDDADLHPPVTNRQVSANVTAVFEYWKSQMGHPKAQLSDDREKAITARLKNGYTLEDIKLAIDGCKASGFHQGENGQGRKYDDIELICRKGSKLEQFIEMALAKRKPIVANANGVSKPMLIDPNTLSPKTRGNAAALQAFIDRGKEKPSND